MSWDVLNVGNVLTIIGNHFFFSFPPCFSFSFCWGELRCVKCWKCFNHYWEPFDNFHSFERSNFVRLDQHLPSSRILHKTSRSRVSFRGFRGMDLMPLSTYKIVFEVLEWFSPGRVKNLSFPLTVYVSDIYVCSICGWEENGIRLKFLPSWSTNYTEGGPGGPGQTWYLSLLRKNDICL